MWGLNRHITVARAIFLSSYFHSPFILSMIRLDFKVLYTIPTASNPTGVSTTLERKQKIYELACEYNIMIMEDDPVRTHFLIKILGWCVLQYFYLQFGPHKIPSYLSIDTQQRVLRFDSFSKIMSAGAREYELDCSAKECAWDLLVDRNRWSNDCPSTPSPPAWCQMDSLKQLSMN